MLIYQIILPENVCKIKFTPVCDDPGVTFCEVKHLNFCRNDIPMRMSVDDSAYRDNYGFRLSDEEISNFLAHREVWERFLASGEEWCLVIENNVPFDSHLLKFQEDIGELPDDWDIFFPYDQEEHFRKKYEKENGSTLLNRNNWEIARAEPYLSGYKYGNSIYFLRRTGARKLLEVDIIKDRLDHTIMSLTAEEDGLNVYSSDVDWFDADLMEDYFWVERSEAIMEAAMGQSSWNDANICEARRLLGTVSRIGKENDIDLILEAGTLLGYVRHGCIMPWDDDIDVGIEEKNLELFFSKVDEHKNLRWSGEFLFHGTRFFKVWDVGNDPIEGKSYTHPFVDVWAYNFEGDDLVFENGIRYPGTAKAGLTEVDFEGSKYKIPSNALEALDSRFTDWRKMIRVYTWAHRLERHHFRYLCIPITTDENGRFHSHSLPTYS